MKAKTRTRTLPDVLGIRLTASEKEAIESAAAEARTTSSKWSREALIRAVNASQDTRLILSELLALRRIFLLLQIDFSKGQKLSEQRLKDVVDDAETSKLAMAEGRIRSFAKQVHGASREARNDG